MRVPGGGVWRRERADRARVVGVHVAQFFSVLSRPHGIVPTWDTPLSCLDRDQLLALARQRGVAGSARTRIDFNSMAVGGLDEVDAGGGTSPWSRVEGASDASAAAALVDPATGRRGMLIRSGSWFAYARDRAVALDACAPLVEQVRSVATTAEAVALLDCEISLGRIDAGRWLVTESTLPHRISTCPGPELRASMFELLSVADTTCEGREFTRTWQITEATGLLHTLSSIVR